MKKAKNIFLFILLALSFNFVVVNKLAVAGSSWGGQIGMTEIGSAYGDNPETEDIRYKVVKIINLILSFLGILCLILIVFAGFKWMTAGGSEDQVKSAQAILKNAVIGLVIILLSWSVTIFIMARMNSIAKNDLNYLNPVYVQ